MFPVEMSNWLAWNLPTRSGMRGEDPISGFAITSLQASHPFIPGLGPHCLSPRLWQVSSLVSPSPAPPILKLILYTDNRVTFQKHRSDYAAPVCKTPVIILRQHKQANIQTHRQALKMLHDLARPESSRLIYCPCSCPKPPATPRTHSMIPWPFAHVLVLSVQEEPGLPSSLPAPLPQPLTHSDSPTSSTNIISSAKLYWIV